MTTDDAFRMIAIHGSRAITLGDGTDAIYAADLLEGRTWITHTDLIDLAKRYNPVVNQLKDPVSTPEHLRRLAYLTTHKMMTVGDLKHKLADPKLDGFWVILENPDRHATSGLPLNRVRVEPNAAEPFVSLTHEDPGPTSITPRTEATGLCPVYGKDPTTQIEHAIRILEGVHDYVQGTRAQAALAHAVRYLREWF